MLGYGLACWDLDNVINDDGVLHPDAIEVLDEVGNEAVWIERSMSGRGLHVFINGSGDATVSQHISYYPRSRFIVVTGQRYRHRAPRL